MIYINAFMYTLLKGIHMKYEKIELWLETLTGDTKNQAMDTWIDHVIKFNADNNYQPHSEDFKNLWDSFLRANA